MGSKLVSDSPPLTSSLPDSVGKVMGILSARCASIGRR